MAAHFGTFGALVRFVGARAQGTVITDVTRVLVTRPRSRQPATAPAAASFWEGLTAGRCAIRPIELFDTEGFRARVGAEVPAGTALPGVSSRRSRADRFAAAAADEAVRDAGLSRAELRPAAVIVGGIGGGMLEAEAWFWRRERDGRRRPGAPDGAPERPAVRPRRRRRAALRDDRAQGDRGPGVQLGRRGPRAGGRADRLRRGAPGACGRGRCHDPHLLHGLQRAQAARSRALPAVRAGPPGHVARGGRGVRRARGRGARPGARRARLRGARRATG